MANYINAEILCEAYSHLEIDLFDDKVALEKLRADLLVFFTERAKFLLGDDVEVRVDFEKGSLKTILTVLGSAALVINATVSGYGSFRQGIDQLAKDSTLLAQSANLEVIFRTKTEYCNRVNVEKRKGVFGRIDEFIREMDGIKRKISDSSLPGNLNEIKEFNAEIDRLVAWDIALDKLFSKLGSSDTEVCVAAGMLEELEKFPKSPPWLVELNSNSFRATLANSDLERAGMMAAAAARLQVTIAKLKEKMQQRVKLNSPKVS